MSQLERCANINVFCFLASVKEKEEEWEKGSTKSEEGSTVNRKRSRAGDNLLLIVSVRPPFYSVTIKRMIGVFIALIHPIQWTIANPVGADRPAKRQKKTSCVATGWPVHSTVHSPDGASYFLPV